MEVELTAVIVTVRPLEIAKTSMCAEGRKKTYVVNTFLSQM